MLTAFQVETVAFLTDGGFICSDCAHKAFEEDPAETADLRPVSRYEMDEYDSENSRDWFSDRETDDEPDHTECACTMGVSCDECGGEIVEPFEDTYAHQDDDLKREDREAGGDATLP